MNRSIFNYYPANLSCLLPMYISQLVLQIFPSHAIFFPGSLGLFGFPWLYLTVITHWHLLFTLCFCFLFVSFSCDKLLLIFEDPFPILPPLWGLGCIPQEDSCPHCLHYPKLFIWIGSARVDCGLPEGQGHISVIFVSPEPSPVLAHGRSFIDVC